MIRIIFLVDLSFMERGGIKPFLILSLVDLAFNLLLFLIQSLELQLCDLDLPL